MKINKPRLFISYSAKDTSMAEQLHKQLETAGFEVWRDQTRLETNWSREIALALAETDAVCLIWTEHAARSKWVKHEWLTARALEKLIVPCLLPNAPALPEPLFNIQGVVFKDVAKDSGKLIERLKSATSFSFKATLNAFSGPFTLAELEHACPGISLDMVRRVLRDDLQKTEKVECLGRGPGAAWRKRGNIHKKRVRKGVICVRQGNGRTSTSQDDGLSTNHSFDD